MGFLPDWLNPYDVLIAFALLGGTALGFVRGLVRMALSVVVLYVAVVLAMSFYDNIGDYITYMSGLPTSASHALGFFLILILTTTLVNFILRRTYRDTELPGLRQVDQLGGMVIGFFFTSIWIGLGILVVAFALGAPVTEDDSLRQNLITYFQESNLIPIFYEFLPVALASLRPWMPKGLPPDILTVRL